MADKVKKDNEILNGRLWDHSDNSLQEIILSLKKRWKIMIRFSANPRYYLKKKKNPVSLLLFLKNACTNFLEL